MSSEWVLGNWSHIQAINVFGQLIIRVSGDKPTPCHAVRIIQRPERIFPPQYALQWRDEATDICSDVLEPYTVTDYFPAPLKETLTIYNQDGPQEVPVVLIADSIEGNVKTIAKGGDNDIPIPFSVSHLLEHGSLELANLSKNTHYAEATGYSYDFSFEEAFKNAVSNLPPDPHPYPDKMTSVTVRSISATYGGITGRSKLVVSVATFF